MVAIGPSNVANRWLAQFEKAEEEALLAIQPIIQQVIKETVGTQYYSLPTLRAMGSPYSAHNPHPPLPPGVVNMQSGRFFESFIITAPTRTSRGIKMMVYSMDEERAEQMAGTEREIMRPYAVLMNDRMNRQVRRALVDALKGTIQVRVRG